MRFHVTHPLVTHPYHPDLVTGPGVVALAQAAEAAGFDGYGFTDHPAPSQRWLDQGGHDALDPFVALGFVAAATTSIRLIPNIVVLPYRNPFVVAKAAATLDVLSGGRFTLATGVGYLEAEYEALGVDHADRAALFDEALDVLVAVWTTDDVSFGGRHFQASGITAHPRPLSQPHPPIWVGGNSAAARRRVGCAWRWVGAVPGAAGAWLGSWAPPRSTAATCSWPASPTSTVGWRRRGATRRRSTSRSRARRAVRRARTTSTPRPTSEGLAALGALGVTWVQVGLPGDSPERALEAVARYGELVIVPHRAARG